MFEPLYHQYIIRYYQYSAQLGTEQQFPMHGVLLACRKYLLQEMLWQRC